MIGSCTQNNENEVTAANEADVETLYVGTYTKKEGHVDGKGDGIYKVQVNKETGELTVIDTILNTVNPSYITIHPNKKFLYAVNEIADGNRIGTVTAYNIEKDEILRISSITSKGDAPCHVSVDQTGQFLTVANYMEVIAIYKIQGNGDSELTESVEFKTTRKSEFRQEASHTHMALHAFDDNSMFVADLGRDLVYHYQMESSGKLKELAPIETMFKAGPRHLAAHPNQSRLYVLNELNSTIEGFDYQGVDKPTKRFQTVSTVEQEAENIAPSAIKIHPNGKFLYSANRAINDGTVNNIAVFSINEESGELELIQSQDSKGLVPRDFTISPDGNFLFVANQNSNTIITFKINQETGKLEETGNVLEISTPVCLKFL